MALLRDATKEYIKSLDNAKDTFSYWVLEHLKMSGAYWGLTAMSLLGALDEMSREEGINFVKSCYHESGGFTGNVGHDPHLLYTLSAVQILCLFDALSEVDVEKTANYILFFFHLIDCKPLFSIFFFNYLITY